MTSAKWILCSEYDESRKTPVRCNMGVTSRLEEAITFAKMLAASQSFPTEEGFSLPITDPITNETIYPQYGYRTYDENKPESSVGVCFYNTFMTSVICVIELDYFSPNCEGVIYKQKLLFDEYVY